MMIGLNTHKTLFILAALIGAVILYIRILTSGFIIGTTTFDHPYIQFAAALIIGGGLAALTIFVLEKTKLSSRLFYGFLALGLVYRALFLGSTPIYEDDWNRYLWDGAAVVQGINPYEYSPKQVIEGAESEIKDVQKLHQYAVEKRASLNKYSHE